MASFDIDFVSLTLCLVGLFFICCAIQQKKPKHILEEAFGVTNPALRELRAAVFKRNQLFLGYGCIVLALLLGIYNDSLAVERGILDNLNPLTISAALVGLTAILCGVLNWLSRLFSKWQFRKIVKDVMAERNLPFESNLPLAVEIGQLLGVELEPGDSVEAYVTKLRAFLELPHEPEGSMRPNRNSRVGIEFR